MIRYTIFFFYRATWSVALIGNDSSGFLSINIDAFTQETYKTNKASGEEYSTFFWICFKMSIFSLLYHIINQKVNKKIYNNYLKKWSNDFYCAPCRR